MAWNKELIAEGVLAPDLNDEIRANWAALEAALGKEMNFSTGGTASLQGIMKQGSARCFFQDTAPATRIDGSAFAATDLGSLWIDTNSSPVNQFNILTATTPTWTPISTEIIATLLASARTFTAALSIQMADPTLTTQNTDEEDSAGGRQTRFIIKGEQSGGEVTTLGWLEFSHEGALDDEKGQCKIYLNAGSDTNTPTLAMTIPSTGVPPTMAASTAPAAEAQLANKKYVDDQDKDTVGAGVSKTVSTNYTAATSGTLVVQCTVTSSGGANAYVTAKSDAAATPTTVVGKAGNDDSAGGFFDTGKTYHTITVPIIKDKKYRVDVTANAVADSIIFYPNQ